MKLTSTRLARIVTDALAPAYLVIAILLIIGWHSTRSLEGLAWGLLAALFCGGIPFAIILFGVKRGSWTDKHVKVRSQRAVPLTATMVSVLVGILIQVVFDAPRELFALVIAMLVGLAATMVVTVWWKVSVHTAVAGGVATILTLAFGPPLAALALVVAAIGWSRVQLRDHTVAQTIIGALLGGVAAAVTFGLLR
ncbi:phosphatase PAP2 family protein [Streptomyces sp. NBC_00264]|uniref:phosphatase PAP2 family protein n=1 Tax=unclassified Streptomyces TaxID=2593676 RepID=UPI002253A6D4|nr:MULTISPECIES: phosphatase PAP2 family protein [unclassified Streptomyces]MCX5163733.1 phosphatase PAP2 family protein [Streptomyces sp. NBC_00305]MCX5222256.1 phosphatase PAP2 family protein [Streptomyces sp. NBC_00264]